MNRNIAVILPALNEVESVKEVVQGFLKMGVRAIVVDNGSVDGTAEVARLAGAHVLHEPRRGYGNACLAGLAYLRSQPPEIVVFADCDGTLDPFDLDALTTPIESGVSDLVLGHRAWIEAGAMPHHQLVGNEIACLLIRIFYRLELRDIPPYRAARWSFISGLGLSQQTYGFPIETVVLTARNNGRVREVDVSYRRRLHGSSKVTGSLTASLMAGLKMVSVPILLRFRGFSVD